MNLVIHLHVMEQYSVISYEPCHTFTCTLPNIDLSFESVKDLTGYQLSFILYPLIVS